MKLSSSAKAYAVIISLIGGAIGLVSTYMYVRHLVELPAPNAELRDILALFVLIIIYRCLPIYINDNMVIDFSIIIGIATLLHLGPYAAASIYFLSMPFVVCKVPGSSKSYYSFFNTPYLKSFFNTGCLVASTFLAGQVYRVTGGEIGKLSFPEFLMPGSLMILVLITLDCILFAILQDALKKQRFFDAFVGKFGDSLATGVIGALFGYVIAKFLGAPGGIYLVALFTFMLMLARFAASMYLSVRQNYYIMMKTLTNTLEAKDEYTRGHSERVEIYSRVIANEMHLPPARIEELSVAALLHDVGKIGIDENILKKPERLNSEERRIIQTHPEISISILKDVKLSPLTLNIILHHHERYDGFGYPESLGQEQLPMEVYAIGVADTYDAITSDRPYNKGRSPEAAREIIIEESGHQFHPEAVEAFLRAYDKGKLNTGRRSQTLPISLYKAFPGNGANVDAG